VKEVDNPRRFGVVETNGTRITGIVEKPEVPPTNLAVVGAYYIKDTAIFRDALREIHDRDVRTKGEIQVTDAFALMIRNGVEMHVCPVEGWFDCGKRETLLETNRHLLKTLPDKSRRTHIEGCVILPPVYIADDATVEKSVLGPNTSVASGTIIKNSIISDSIISAGARVENARLTASLVGNNAYVRGSFKVLNVGDSSEICY
jgi:glucose-1-phosphate thymidylyltransferase